MLANTLDRLQRAPLAMAPGPNEVGEAAVDALVALRLDLGVQSN